MRSSFSRLAFLPIMAAFLMIIALPVSAVEPMTDEEVAAIIAQHEKERDQMFSSGSGSLEKYQEMMQATLAKFDIASLTPRQISMIEQQYLLRDEVEAKKAAVERLEAFREDQGVDGATAAVVRLSLLGAVTRTGRPEAELQATLLDEALSHPALAEAFHSGDAGQLFNAVYGIHERSVWKEARDRIIALEELLTDDMPADAVSTFEGYLTILGYLFEDPADETKQRIRRKLVAAARQVLSDAKAGKGDLIEGEIDFFEGMIARMDGAKARGEFLNHTAPALDIIWSSDPAFTSLADFKDRVVVLDFWATWCGPCVASFPNVQELVAHYEGYPVSVIGVTSLQGTHYGAEGPIDCKDDPQKEFDLMPGYMKEKDINWTIAFSEQEVFNPDYGVGGIPHVVIIDPKGVVRHAGLHPANPLEEKTEKINELLVEAGLPAPAAIAKPVEGEEEGSSEGDGSMGG